MDVPEWKRAALCDWIHKYASDLSPPYPTTANRLPSCTSSTNSPCFSLFSTPFSWNVESTWNLVGINTCLLIRLAYSWAVSRKKVPNVLSSCHTFGMTPIFYILFFYSFIFCVKSRCHTKRRAGARGHAHPSFFGIYQKNGKCARPHAPILLLVWQRLTPLGTFFTLYVTWQPSSELSSEINLHMLDKDWVLVSSHCPRSTKFKRMFFM